LNTLKYDASQWEEYPEEFSGLQIQVWVHSQPSARQGLLCGQLVQPINREIQMKPQRVPGRLAIILLAGLGIAASAHASGLSANPSPVNLSAMGGELAWRYVTFTNNGPGFASNLDASLSGGAHTSILKIVGDTCTGARLAQGGTCTVRVEFEAACYVRAGSNDVWQLMMTSTEFPELYTTVNGTVTTDGCI
jgi:hypothetical protein